jgi:hypothetical protein
MKPSHLLCGALLASLCVSSGGARAQEPLGIPASERAVLLSLYTSSSGATWTNRTNWSGAAGTECRWYGVTCNSSGNRVTGISLDENNLIGTLPANLNALTNLAVFTVGGNRLAGTLPPLTGLSNLAHFDASANQLSGTIPALTSLTSLDYFDVSGNRLSASIPALTGLSKLEFLYVNDNQLTGSIPPLTDQHILVAFDVSGNQLIGSAPSVPVPNLLGARGSRLCPNFLNHAPDPAWDVATGQTPWYTNCGIAPQVGLWWNPTESGTGYALDFKHGVLVVTVYSYTASGPPIWYLASGPVTNNTFTATIDKYQSGQCISCAYRPATINGNDGTISIFFTSPTSATITLPGGRNFQIVPQDF